MNPHWPNHNNFLFSGGRHHHHPTFTAGGGPIPHANHCNTNHDDDNNSNSNSHNNNNNNPFWMDEFLDFSQARRGAHRRSASDSIAFLDSSSFLEDGCGLDVGAGNNPSSRPGSDFNRFNDERFASLFTDEISPQLRAATNSNSNDGAAAGEIKVMSDSSTPTSDHHNGINEDNRDHQLYTDAQMATAMKNEADGDDHSPCESEPNGDNGGAATANTTGSSDRIVDPKRVKRILANRQSAQKSRVRKLQYISELEHRVTSLQAEVSMLSPRVAFLDHQRLMLSVDNSALKQRIAALAQDKIFKDAHQDALKREIERLNQVYQQRNVETIKMDNGNAFAPVGDSGCADHSQDLDGGTMSFLIDASTS